MPDTERTSRNVPNRRRRIRGSVAVVAVVALAMAVGLVAALTPSGTTREAQAAGGCKRYVAAGDHLPAGHEVSEDQRYPEQLAENHLFNSPTLPGWCLYNIAANETTSATYLSGGQLAQTWTLRPDLITLTVGEENDTIVNIVNSCFDKLKDHDFSGANACAAQILGNPALWNDLTSNLTTTLQYYRMIMAGRPWLVIALTGYPNPYPDAAQATAKIAQLCTPLVDTIPTCTARWVQLPPALITIDQVFKKLNTTIEDALAPFQAGPNGYRYVFVDTYTKLRDHCMKMEVEIKTKVYHPPNQVHDHNSQKINFGCDDPWFVAGSDGTKRPDYLQPASTGILIQWSQTTKGMGTHPDADGHQCIADLIWEADTLYPGTTPLKWLLDIGEPADSSICQ